MFAAPRLQEVRPPCLQPPISAPPAPCKHHPQHRARARMEAELCEMDWSPCWGNLPAELLLHIARLAGRPGELAGTKSQLRLVCRDWRLALPHREPLRQCICWRMGRIR